MRVIKAFFFLSCLLVCVSAFLYKSTRRLNSARTMLSMDTTDKDAALKSKMQEAVEADPDLKQFLAGNVAKWKGTADSLKRRKQVGESATIFCLSRPVFQPQKTHNLFRPSACL